MFDDLESLYWVLLYVATRRFAYDGILPERLFDEIHEGSHEFIGRISLGGDKKRDWLMRSEIEFRSAELERFFTSYRGFIRDYMAKVDRADGNEAVQQELNELREHPEDSFQTLFACFNDVLDDATADWDYFEADGVPTKLQRPNAKRKLIRQAVHRSTANGLWRGASGWRRPTTTLVAEPAHADDRIENGGTIVVAEGAVVGGESISFRLPPIDEDHEDEVGSSTSSESDSPQQRIIARDVSEHRILRPRPTAAVTRR